MGSGAALVLAGMILTLFVSAGPLAPNVHAQTPSPTPSPTAPPTPTSFPTGGPAPLLPGGPVPLPPAGPAPLLPGGPAPAPFPSSAPGQVGSGAPPQDIFYVSPVGCDPGSANCGVRAPVSPNLPCTATGPCQTVAFALSQARDGDAISLAGGIYPISSPIEVTKLVTIGPNGFAPGSTAAATQFSTTVSQLCGTLSATLPASSTCSAILGVAVFPGSSVTLAITAAPGNLVQVPQGGALPAVGGTGPLATRCTLTTPLPSPAAPDFAATLTYTCAPGQSIPASTSLSVNVSVFANGNAEQPPTMTASVSLPTTSARPVIQSCASVVPATSTAAAQCTGAGGPVFHVTAVGSAALHVTIFGLTIGNAASLSGPAAVILDNDSYTEIAKNVIGAQDLPNAIGILLRASDHPIVHDNTIQGSTFFTMAPVLSLGLAIGGFGIVTAECLGSFNHSNGVQLVNNLFAKNANAGVWFCSDGTGGFLVNQNTIRANGRGIVLIDAVDTVISGNTIGDNLLDGIDLLQTSARNQISGNTIESQQGTTSAGILLAGNGVLFPLGNQITQNQIRRNTVDVSIVGAQGTRLTYNSITAVGNNTGVLFALGNLNLAFGQPLNTIFSNNALQANGICSARTGCAIRLTAGVTVPIDATGSNDFGITDPAAIQVQIWDHGRDPLLGTVYVLAAVPPPLTLPILGLTPTLLPPPSQSVPAPPVPSSAPSSEPSGSRSPAPAASGTPAPSPAPESSGQATVYLDTASGSYYVVLMLCVTDTDNRPVANDALTIDFFAENQSRLGGTMATTDAGGCFRGNVRPAGGTTTQPVRVVITDPSGATYVFSVVAGSPITRPP